MNDAHEADGRYAGWSLAAALADIDLRLRFVEMKADRLLALMGEPAQFTNVPVDLDRHSFP